MPDPSWLPYLGAVTGGVGAFTGIAGAIMGFVSYRRSGNIKALDLRLVLRKDQEILRRIVNELPPLIDRAKDSRLRMASARTGGVTSGAIKYWNDEREIDLATAKSLQTQLPELDFDYSKLTHSDLESQIVAVHSRQLTATQLQQKYLAALAADDRAREQIEADMRAFMKP